MVNSNKKVIWTLIIIGALIFFMQPEDKKEAQADVNNAQISRTMPATIEANTPFTVTYQTSGIGLGSWGVLIEDTISGGCSPSSINTGFLSPQSSLNIQVTSPLSGACTFNGKYLFASSTEKQMTGTSSISIIVPVSCTDLKASALNKIVSWSVNPSSENRVAALTAISSWASSC